MNKRKWPRNFRTNEMKRSIPTATEAWHMKKRTKMNWQNEERKGIETRAFPDKKLCGYRKLFLWRILDFFFDASLFRFPFKKKLTPSKLKQNWNGKEIHFFPLHFVCLASWFLFPLTHSFLSIPHTTVCFFMHRHKLLYYEAKWWSVAILQLKGLEACKSLLILSFWRHV